MNKQNIDPDKKDKYGVSRNDINFNKDDIINIPMILKFTHKEYSYKHFIKAKEKYKGRRARVNEIYFVFNKFWRVNFSWIDAYGENQPSFHLCFVCADFLGCSSLKKTNKDLLGLIEVK